MTAGCRPRSSPCVVAGNNAARWRPTGRASGFPHPPDRPCPACLRSSAPAAPPASPPAFAAPPACRRQAASAARRHAPPAFAPRSEEHTSELQSLMRISYAVFCLKKKKDIQKRINVYMKKKEQKLKKETTRKKEKKYKAKSKNTFCHQTTHEIVNKQIKEDYSRTQYLTIDHSSTKSK